MIYHQFVTVKHF